MKIGNAIVQVRTLLELVDRIQEVENEAKVEA